MWDSGDGPSGQGWCQCLHWLRRCEHSEGMMGFVSSLGASGIGSSDLGLGSR